MPTLIHTGPRPRLLLAIGLYVGLVVAAGVAFSFVRQDIAEGSSARYIYALFGPALSLFTHMGYFLFALQSLLLLPWLLLGVIRVDARKLAISAFVVCWLGIGYYMHDLF